MISDSIKKMAGDIGYDIGHSDDSVQANLLNGFSRALVNGMTDHALDLQICYIVDKLDTKSKKIIKIMAGFIELAEKIS